MPLMFSRLVLFANIHHVYKGTAETLAALQNVLSSQAVELLVEENTAASFTIEGLPTIKLEQLGKTGDLIIVVGGDGSLLSAARSAVKVNVPVLGINKGRLGFLTDILPDEIETKIAAVISGKYIEEHRFLLEATIKNNGKTTYQAAALNDVVLMPGQTPHLIEFEILINDALMCHQRADGLIIATPTGSTAYALSGGGPILHPNLDAIVLVPMFPHTLSSRPIVIDGNNSIKLLINDNNEQAPQLTCDGHQRTDIAPNSQIHIQKKPEKLCLIHPLDYNYYQTLRSKLGWESKYK